MTIAGLRASWNNKHNCHLLRAMATLILLFCSIVSRPAHAQELVDVELVLLADASNSVDDAEIKFQRRGYADAIIHADVLSAISKGPLGKIAITFVEWGDDFSQDVVVPWTIITDFASARSFSKALISAPRKAIESNAIGAAIAGAQRQIEFNQIKGYRKIVDLSADSANNWTGVSIAEARANALVSGIVINGLALLCRDDDCSGRPVAYDLEAAFQKEIIGGPGSFVVTAESVKSFAAAIRRKLILELAHLRDVTLTGASAKKADVGPAGALLRQYQLRCSAPHEVIMTRVMTDPVTNQNSTSCYLTRYLKWPN